MWVTVLGLPDQLYWDCCPREIEACFMEYYRLQDTINGRYGTVAASIFNAVPGGPKSGKRKWLDWTNFFQPLMSRKKLRDKEKQLAEAQATWKASMDAWQGGALRRK
jgi:hypothetical protein